MHRSQDPTGPRAGAARHISEETLMRPIRALACAAAPAIALLAPAHAGVLYISDDFEADSSADYTIVEQGGPDSTSSFAFDYIAAGIPLAPRSAPGDRRGLRFTANNSLGASNAVTAFHNTGILTDNYTVFVDVWLNNQASEGTTEHAHIGVAGDGVTPNQLFSPISGSGHYLAFTGDGGSTSDYRHHLESIGPVPAGDLSYLNSTNSTNSSADTYQSLFPSPPYDIAGSPGNAWTTLRIDIVGGIGGTITYSLDGATGMTPIIRDTVEVAQGKVSLGYADLFTSVASPAGSQFVIYDNLVVVPAPSASALALTGLVAFSRRRR